MSNGDDESSGHGFPSAANSGGNILDESPFQRQKRIATFAGSTKYRSWKRKATSEHTRPQSEKKVQKRLDDLVLTARHTPATPREVAALGKAVTPGVVSDSDDEVSKIPCRKKNFVYSGRRYMRQIIDFEDLEEKTFILRDENLGLTQENSFLESLFRKANHIICTTDLKPESETIREIDYASSSNTASAGTVDTGTVNKSHAAQDKASAVRAHTESPHAVSTLPNARNHSRYQPRHSEPPVASPCVPTLGAPPSSSFPAVYNAALTTQVATQNPSVGGASGSLFPALRNATTPTQVLALNSNVGCSSYSLFPAAQNAIAPPQIPAQNPNVASPTVGLTLAQEQLFKLLLQGLLPRSRP